MLPTLQNTYADGTSQFKAGAASALCEMAQVVGKEYTVSKVIPILMELLKDENSDVKLNVVSGLVKIANVIGEELLTPNLLTTLTSMTKDGQWRVRMGVFEVIADLAIIFGKDVFSKCLQQIFMGYLTNTAASVRTMGINKSSVLAQSFKSDWVMNEYIPVVTNHYTVDKKGYNYRMCCLNSLASIMPFIQKDQITQHLLPIFLKATRDDIPNVKFCVSKIIHQQRQFIDPNVFSNQLMGPLKEMSNDQDKDVAYFAQLALQASPIASMNPTTI
jgi:serine/threonine-protein phosphatase 2A regulatory subunit A